MEGWTNKSNDSTWGSVNIDIAKVPQNIVEGLVEDLSALSVGIKESYKEFQSFKNLIKEIHKTLIIGFSVLVVFMLATWGYLTYTFFKQ
jgi:hypothetical protein